MARPRNYVAETRRRNELARKTGASSYYQQRIARAEASRPRISRRAARGHPEGAEKVGANLVRAVRRLPPEDGQVSFTGIDRQPDGTWRQARFDLLPGDQAFIINEDGLHQLPYIADVIAKTGILTLGLKYLNAMVAWIEAGLLFTLGRLPKGRRRGNVRHVVTLDKAGRARTSTSLADAMMFSSFEDASLFNVRHGLEGRGYQVTEISA